ncbi:MAG TPA: tetratricopeptide repeat protein, partial [Acidobacteriota bacterium]|nr:tetratricopeptide repeat protein [Acidobacteriota bacterium]
WISAPGLAPTRIKQQVRLIDFVPTVLSIMHVKAAASWDGVVLPSGAGQAAVLESLFPQLQLGWSPLTAVRTGEWKYIEAPRPELYDLVRDPDEGSNLVEKRVDVAKKLKAMLPASAPAAPSKIDPEVAERLASLGYVGGGAGGAGSGADPKDRIAIWNEIEKAVDLEKSDSAGAIKVLESARTADPGNPMVLNMLAERYADAGRSKDAEQILSGILKQNPGNTLALARMAHLQLRAKHPAEARKIAETLLKADPGGVEAHLVAAQACLSLKDAACATAHLEGALTVDPLDHETRNDLGNLYLQQGKPAAAVQEFNRVLQKDPQNLQSLNGLATEAYQGKRYGECEGILQKALKIRKDDTQTRMNLALLYSQTDRVPQAIDLYQKIIADAQTPGDWKTEATARLKELQP